jgi:hypothetical protein
MTEKYRAEITAALEAIPAPPWRWIGLRQTGPILVTAHSGQLYLLGVEHPRDADRQATDTGGVPLYGDLLFRDQRPGERHASMRAGRQLAIGRAEYDPDTIRGIDNPIARWFQGSAAYAADLLAELGRLTATPDPHAVHRVTVTAPVGKHEYFAAAEDWNTTLYCHGGRVNAYRIEHPGDCDRLAYGQRCALDRFADDNAPSEVENWPVEPGEYTARCLVHHPMNGTDAREYIGWEPVSTAGKGDEA